ncbi:MAG: DUF1573 domain-containing protein [Isosphaeraceae bacterium]
MRRRAWGVRVLGLAGGLMLAGRRVQAAGWANGLFLEQSHDFGPVPRGAIVRHPFVLVNRTNEALNIIDVRASCGCTTGWANASLVPPGQSATVEAQMDTRNFVGRKETVLFVTVATASGRQGEARLGVGSTILSDIVLNPGGVDFGVVARGQTPSQILTIERVGNPNWRLTRMASGCRAIDATLVEAGRTAAGAAYRMTVTLKSDAPAGTFRDEIRVFTNDPQSPVVPVLVTGSVRGELTASPNMLALGQVSSTAPATGKFLVRATRPFVIKGFEGIGDGFKALVDDATPKPIHVVTVQFHPEESTTRGDLRKVIRAHSDLAGEPPVDLTVTLHVNP